MIQQSSRRYGIIMQFIQKSFRSKGYEIDIYLWCAPGYIAQFALWVAYFWLSVFYLQATVPVLALNMISFLICIVYYFTSYAKMGQKLKKPLPDGNMLSQGEEILMESYRKLYLIIIFSELIMLMLLLSFATEIYISWLPTDGEFVLSEVNKSFSVRLLIFCFITNVLMILEQMTQINIKDIRHRNKRG